ncbi:hypothetical protein EVAR_40782_1 [Eumeta japonica]|uniref:Uncharacterized protein n=1 Tax=Eumeta variegata TaxID=151549 RepID=A0A4C1X460_EUMVA|nr:hypothetical protein EVAR_40782_1 [Eumeta japonica]
MSAARVPGVLLLVVAIANGGGSGVRLSASDLKVIVLIRIDPDDRLPRTFFDEPKVGAREFVARPVHGGSYKTRGNDDGTVSAIFRGNRTPGMKQFVGESALCLGAAAILFYFAWRNLRSRDTRRGSSVAEVASF